MSMSSDEYKRLLHLLDDATQKIQKRYDLIVFELEKRTVKLENKAKQTEKILESTERILKTLIERLSIVESSVTKSDIFELKEIAKLILDTKKSNDESNIEPDLQYAETSFPGSDEDSLVEEGSNPYLHNKSFEELLQIQKEISNYISDKMFSLTKCLHMARAKKNPYAYLRNNSYSLGDLEEFKSVIEHVIKQKTELTQDKINNGTMR